MRMLFDREQRRAAARAKLDRRPRREAHAAGGGALRGRLDAPYIDPDE
jgi:hypothetical protein